jgi:hypothetical protein
MFSEGAVVNDIRMDLCSRTSLDYLDRRYYD